MAPLAKHFYVAAWILATGAMVGGAIWFSLDQSTRTYWLGGLLWAPFVLLLLERAHRKGFSGETPPDYGRDDAPWSGP
jgi:hypothetical protein